MIEILQIVSDGEERLARLGCACGDPSLALYNCEDGQIIFCSRCGEITTRERLINHAPEPLTSERLTWLNVTNRAECPLVNVSLPVTAVFAAAHGDGCIELPALVTKISIEKCFLRLEEAAHPELLERPQQILLRAGDFPLVGETPGYIEEILRPHGLHGPTYFKARLDLASPQRKSELESFFQSTCGLRFDWRVLLYADQGDALRLRQLIHECLPMARIEVAADAQEFTRLLGEHRPDLSLLPPVPELMQMVNRADRAGRSHPQRMLVLINERTASAIQLALRWGADDILTYHCSLEDMRRAIQRCQKKELEDCGLAPQALPSASPNAQEQPINVSMSEADAVQILCMASETHDTNSSNHLSRMSAYTAAIARQLGWSGLRVEHLGLASKLHDVGKLGVPDAILHKTGALTEDERRVMQLHSRRGYQILHASTAEVMRLGATIALRHHERYDGTGYPDGLAGEAIPLEAQIVSIADVFDALTTARAYKPAWSNEKTLTYLQEQAGRMFAPVVVEAFMGVLSEIEDTQLHFMDDFREIWTERRKYARYPSVPVPITLDIVMPEQTFHLCQIHGQLCNLSLGGMQVLLNNVSADLYTQLAQSRRYAKLECSDPAWHGLHQTFCGVVWLDYYAIPDPHGCLMGLSFQRTSAELQDSINRLLSKN